MKNFLIALLVGVIICNVFGAALSEWWGVHFMFGSESVSFFESVLIYSGIAVLMVGITFLVAISIAAALAVAALVVLLGIFFTGISLFWPILLVIGIYYLVKKREPEQRYGTSH